MESKVPAIISVDLWQKANDMTNTRRKTCRYNYLFSYLLRCEECNTILLHESVIKYKGRVSLYYKCPKCRLRINENVVMKECKAEIYNKLVKNKNSVLMIYKNRMANNVKKINKLKEHMHDINEYDDCKENIASLEELNKKTKEKYNQVKNQDLSFETVDVDILMSWLVNNIDKIICNLESKKMNIIWKNKHITTKNK